jgi:peptidyl-prolyl cis-trans isomerase D
VHNTKLYALIILGLLIAGLAIVSYYSVSRGLRGLRSQFHLTKWLLYAIVAIFAFGLFQGIGVGGAGFFGRDTTLREEGIIARVAGQPIRQADVERQLNNYGIEGDQRKQIASSYIIPQAIQGAVMDEAARRAGITVSDEELRAKLRDEVLPGMKIPETENLTEAYEKRLKRMGYTTAEFEEALRSDLRREKYNRLLVDAQIVRPEEAKSVYMKEKDIVNADYFMVDSGPLVAALPDPKPAEIEAAYQRDIAQYQFGERRALKVLAARPATFQQAFKPGDAELKRYFDTVKKDYRRASHIMVRLAPQADPGAEAKVKEQADKYLARARTGEDFAAIAAVGSEDPGSKGKGGDLGWFSKGTMVAEFDKAVFSATLASPMVGPIKTQFGYHVIKLTGTGEELKEIPAELKPVIEQKYTASQADGFKKQADALKPKLLAVKSEAAMKQLADGNKLSIKDTGAQPIEKSGYIPEVGADPELMNKVFAAKPGDIITGELKPSGAVVIQVTEILPAGPKPLDQNLSFQIKGLLKQKTALEQAKQKAVLLAAALAKGGTLKDAAEKTGLAKKAENGQPAVEVKTLTYNASQKSLGEFPDEPELAAKLLATEKDQALGPLELKRGALVAKVTERKHPDEAEFAKSRAEIVNRLKTEKAEMIRGHEIELLKKQLEKTRQIIRNDELINREYKSKQPEGMPQGMPEDMPLE